jgi:hypothetical protein
MATEFDYKGRKVLVSRDRQVWVVRGPSCETRGRVLLDALAQALNEDDRRLARLSLRIMEAEAHGELE